MELQVCCTWRHLSVTPCNVKQSNCPTPRRSFWNSMLGDGNAGRPGFDHIGSVQFFLAFPWHLKTFLILPLGWKWWTFEGNMLGFLVLWYECLVWTGGNEACHAAMLQDANLLQSDLAGCCCSLVFNLVRLGCAFVGFLFVDNFHHLQLAGLEDYTPFPYKTNSQ